MHFIFLSVTEVLCKNQRLRGQMTVEFLQYQQVFSSFFVGSVRLHNSFITAMPLLISITYKAAVIFLTDRVMVVLVCVT